MIKIDKNIYPLYFSIKDEFCQQKHIFCVKDFDAVDVALEVAYFNKIVKTKLFVVISSSDFNFVYFIDNFVFYFQEVPERKLLLNFRKEMGL